MVTVEYSINYISGILSVHEKKKNNIVRRRVYRTILGWELVTLIFKTRNKLSPMMLAGGYLSIRIVDVSFFIHFPSKQHDLILDRARSCLTFIKLKKIIYRYLELHLGFG